MNKIVFVAVVLFASLIFGQHYLMNSLESQSSKIEFLDIPLEKIRTDDPSKVFEDAEVEIYRLNDRYIAIRKDVAV